MGTWGLYGCCLNTHLQSKLTLPPSSSTQIHWPGLVIWQQRYKHMGMVKVSLTSWTIPMGFTHSECDLSFSYLVVFSWGVSSAHTYTQAGSKGELERSCIFYEVQTLLPGKFSKIFQTPPKAKEAIWIYLLSEHQKIRERLSAYIFLLWISIEKFNDITWGVTLERKHRWRLKSGYCHDETDNSKRSKKWQFWKTISKINW